MPAQDTSFGSTRPVSPMTWDDLVASFPAAPDASLDGVLDATGDCLGRIGPDRTTMTDLARVAGIARSTLYQRVASVDHAMVLFAIRELHRFLEPRRRPGVEIGDVDDIGRFLADFIRWVRAQPAFERIMAEPVVVGRVAAAGAPGLDVVAAMLSGPVAMLADAGIIGALPTDLVAGWLPRVIAMCCVAPPPGDLDDAIARLVLPALRP